MASCLDIWGYFFPFSKLKFWGIDTGQQLALTNHTIGWEVNYKDVYKVSGGRMEGIVQWGCELGGQAGYRAWLQGNVLIR